MRFIKTTYHPILSLLILLMLAATACTDDALNEMETPAEPAKGASAFITLNVKAPVQTRGANTPQGGEEGDGQRPDQDRESYVDNLTVFFYQAAEGESLNDAAADPTRTILATAHFSDLTHTTSADDEDIYTTETREVKLEDGAYRMLVVANLPSIVSAMRPETRLSDLCMYLKRDLPWRVDAAGNCTRFVMSSYEEKSVTLKAADTTKESPSLISGIALQRLAARIDFEPKADGDNSYTINNFRIQVNAVKVVNRLIAGTYLLKQTAPTVNSGTTYPGKETADADGRATNYVIDPWTSGKTADKYNSPEDHYKALYEEPAEDAHAWTADDDIKTPATGNTAYTLCYALENTTDKDQQLCGYSTGIIIKTTGIPQKVINEAGVSEDNADGAIDFCIYQDKVYKNKEALIANNPAFKGLNDEELTDEELSARGAKCYKAGVMYYPYFIRHSYNAAATNDIMEFAIVRNNVYNLKINSFSSPGNAEDTVDPSIPSKETYVTIGATVRPWNVLDEENIVM